MNLKPDEFRCAACDGVFTRGQTAEEAEIEYASAFPEHVEEPKVLVCNDCYNNFNKRPYIPS